MPTASRDASVPEGLRPVDAERTYRVLLVWPKFPPSFWSWQATVQAVGRKAALPPLGLITVAAMCPGHWELRVIDEAVQPITDRDLAWADLVMVSAMEIQRGSVKVILNRARDAGRRTVIGGPYAASHTKELALLADHVVSGEVEESFSAIAAALEAGRADPVYVLTSKPDVTLTPIPRYDLLNVRAYTAMSAQFSRGCPFQCEFCDIIVLYGRKPRTKPPAQLVSELDAVRAAGWRGEVFLVDDNFIGNHVRAKELCVELKAWQRRHNYPLAFYTEASVNLAQRTDLIEAMVDANFQYVFLGIETPSSESLHETRKFQNLRTSLVDSVHTLLKNGLWVMGGFIVGFDNDDETIFQRQQQFIEEAAIPWAMVGMLQALRHTALHERLQKEERLYPDSTTGDNLSLPNFRTTLSRRTLAAGYCDLLDKLYSPAAYFKRSLRSMELWRTRPPQTPPKLDWKFKLTAFLGGVWHLGFRSHYKAQFWSALIQLVLRWWREPAKMQHGFSVLLAARHMVQYSDYLTKLYRSVEVVDDPVTVPITV